MKQIIVIDVGGTSIKYGLWNEGAGKLSSKGRLPTPTTLEKFYQTLETIVVNFKDEQVDGVGFSIPGAVDQKKGIIGGISAIPYIHNFPIRTALEGRLRLPITLENDANCAALAEISIGVATDLKNIIFMVIGTGVGGAVVVNRQIIHGTHQLGGEFGMLLGHGNKRLSFSGTAKRTAEAYNENYGTSYTGKDLIALAEDGNQTVKEYTDSMYYNLAKAIYNLQFIIDPEAIVIGGGVSENKVFLDNLNFEIKRLVAGLDGIKMIPKIIPAKYHNDSNLIGAAYNFYH